MIEKAFSLTVHNDGLVELCFDMPDKSVNVFNKSTLSQLEIFISELERDKHIKGLLFQSAKTSFIAGADIQELSQIKEAKDAEQKSRQGQDLFHRLESLTFPTLACIHGLCLGGGAELALACRYRIVSDSDTTRFAFPETQLGILPAWGGTQRLPKLIGLQAALPLILTGKAIKAKKAVKIGLADECFPEAIFYEKSLEYLNKLAFKGKALLRRKKHWIASSPVARFILKRAAAKQVLKATHGHYPAPLEALDVLIQSAGKYSAKGIRLETQAFARLVTGPVCQSLVSLYFLREKAKSEVSEYIDTYGNDIKQMGLIGGGVMGSGIAQIATFKKREVRLRDISTSALSDTKHRIQKTYNNLVKKKKMTRQQAQICMDRLSLTSELTGFKNSDLVLEAAVENLDIKQDIFAELEKITPKNCVLASNTSAISIARISQSLKHPERVVGMHFFNPVARMPLVEIIRSPLTSNEAAASALGLTLSLGKLPVVVKDAPGFLVNRLLMPYMLEAALLMDEGAHPERLDRLALDFGMPMGPASLFDEVGIDVASHTASTLKQAFPLRVQESRILKILHQENALGKKTGVGFYDYRIRKPLPSVPFSQAQGKVRLKIKDELILDRLFYPMVNEACRCLEEGIVNSPENLDLAMIMGTGFPPFKGGLLRWAQNQGVERIHNRLKGFAESGMKRHRPSQALIKFASLEKAFFQ